MFSKASWVEMKLAFKTYLNKFLPQLEVRVTTEEETIKNANIT